MSEYFGVESIGAGLWIYYVAILALALVLTVIWAKVQIEAAYEDGFQHGKRDLDGEIIKAENSGYRKGYMAGKDAGIFMGKSHADKSGPKSTKTPAKKPSKPSNTRRVQSGTNKPKSASKKPVKKSVKGK